MTIICNPRNRHLIFILLLFFISSCDTKHYTPLSGDLLFQLSEENDFSDAIIQSTGDRQKLAFSHVGIVETDGDKTFVIDAVPEYGVRKVSLAQFLSSSAKSPEGTPMVVAYRVKSRLHLQNPVEKTVSFMRMPYDSVFAMHNQAFYCSELVYETYLDEENRPIFQLMPMSFSDSAGNRLPYWESYFENLNCPIPEGEPGTNPTQLSQSEHLTICYQYW